MKNMDITYNKYQQGNVMFLILVAVVLFAALSYVVTQSVRGGSNANNEKTLVTSAELVQMVSGIRTAFDRMHFKKGITAADIVLCDGDVKACDTLGDIADLCSSGPDCLFSTDGGGLISFNIPNGYGFYIYDERDNLRITNIGTAASDIALIITNDFVSPAMSYEMCDAINNGFGLPTEEELTTDWIMADGLTVAGKFDFCVDTNSGPNTNYRYYAVLTGF